MRPLFLALLILLGSSAGAAEEVTQQGPPIPYLGLRIAGFVSFTSLYLASVLNAVLNGAFGLGGFSSSSANGLFIPLAGPFVSAFHPSNRSVVNATFLSLDGLGQVAGATLLVLSWALPSPAAQTAWRIVPGPGTIALTARF